MFWVKQKQSIVICWSKNESTCPWGGVHSPPVPQAPPSLNVINIHRETLPDGKSLLDSHPPLKVRHQVPKTLETIVNVLISPSSPSPGFGRAEEPLQAPSVYLY